MGIKPALGWLALLLFTTTAQAEGARELFKNGSATKVAQGKLQPVSMPVVVAPGSVTPKTKAPPATAALTQVAQQLKARAPLTVTESTAKPRADYDVKGTVLMVFEGQKTNAFHVAKDRIHRAVRMAAEERSIATIGRVSTSTLAPRSRDHIDVLETEDGVVLIDSRVDNAGATTSDVYVFAANATLDQRVGSLQAIPTPAQDRLREALVIAEWAPIKN